MKKEEVKVLIRNKKDTKQIKAILKALGESVCNLKHDEKHESYYYSNEEKTWFPARETEMMTPISIRDLIILLTNPEEESKKEFVMVSEDGVGLNFGDEYYRAEIYKGSWILSTFKGDVYLGELEPTDYVLNSPNEAKAFSTKEAAEKWIEEQNKPKQVCISLFNPGSSAEVSKDVIMLNIDGYRLGIKPSDIEDMLHAYKNIQS